MSEVVVNRYSDEDLEEFRALIEKKSKRLKRTSKYIRRPTAVSEMTQRTRPRHSKIWKRETKCFPRRKMAA